MVKKLIHDRTVVYNINYHIVWSVKYRRPVLVNEVENSLRRIIESISQEKGFFLHDFNCDKDHVHVFISAKPKVAPSYIYKMLKGISARLLFLEHPELKKSLWGGHLWNPSTYIETVGHVSEETIKKYVQDQKKK
jgi:putative transposase